MIFAAAAAPAIAMPAPATTAACAVFSAAPAVRPVADAIRSAIRAGPLSSENTFPGIGGALPGRTPPYACQPEEHHWCAPYREHAAHSGKRKWRLRGR
ncbi:hypothetical protein Msi02_24750 [Microbispora siamensis]|uniref:Tannase/feruloyl esterase family alpha/beta hydrolase n=1 Tax=Microbispora siamensis TaxID=564413 RepID=A0ABQ4GJQ2_9ACTN|nr:hypothetical protein Msi02_24750 [Microbispora siamensis]